MISRARVLDRKITTLIHSLLLVVGMLGLLATLGWLAAGVEGLVWVFVIGGVFMLVGLRVSPALVLRLYRARPLSPPEAPTLFRVVTTLAARAELSRPPAPSNCPASSAKVRSPRTAANATFAFNAGE